MNPSLRTQSGFTSRDTWLWIQKRAPDDLTNMKWAYEMGQSCVRPKSCVINQLDYPHYWNLPFDLPHTITHGRCALWERNSLDAGLVLNTQVLQIDLKQENMIAFATHQPSFTVRTQGRQYWISIPPFMCAHIKHDIPYSSPKWAAHFFLKCTLATIAGIKIFAYMIDRSRVLHNKMIKTAVLCIWCHFELHQ